jgi:hypothetical protein
MELLRDIAHDSGGYMSDGDFLELNLQEAFYGTNYARLYELKQRYDPTGVSFALTGIGHQRRRIVCLYHYGIIDLSSYINECAFQIVIALRC